MRWATISSEQTNPGPTTTPKKVWICDICHRQIHVRKKISIRYTRIDHWVHLRCTGICRAQYTDTWTCHIHKESRLTIPPHPPSPSTKPHHTHDPPTQTHVPHSLCSYRIGKSQTQSSHPAPSHSPHFTHSTYTSHPTHHSSLARCGQLTQNLNHMYHHLPQPLCTDTLIIIII